MFLVEIDEKDANNICNIKDLCYYKVRVEPYITKTPPNQCENCQQYFHTAEECRLKAAAGSVRGNTTNGTEVTHGVSPSIAHCVLVNTL